MKLLTVIHYIKRLKDKNHMPFSIHKVEEFGKILLPLILKTLQNKNESIAENVFTL